MRLEDLKVGDKVDFIIPKHLKNITRIQDTGIIKYFSEVNGVIIACPDIDFWIPKDYIISKLSAVLDPMTSNQKPISFVETPIKKEETLPCIQESIKISDLKVGDKVRYGTDFSGKETIDFGIINSQEDDYGYFRMKDIKGSVNLRNADDKGGIHKKHIIAKIIELDKNYKEIPIEKEKNKLLEAIQPFQCPRCHNGWGEIRYYGNSFEAKYCLKCVEEMEKSAPKSFKFDFRVSEIE